MKRPNLAEVSEVESTLNEALDELHRAKAGSEMSAELAVEVMHHFTLFAMEHLLNSDRPTEVSESDLAFFIQLIYLAQGLEGSGIRMAESQGRELPSGPELARLIILNLSELTNEVNPHPVFEAEIDRVV